MRPRSAQPFLHRFISWYLNLDLTQTEILWELVFLVPSGCWRTPHFLLKQFEIFNGSCHSTVGGLKASCVKFQRNKCAVSESRSSRGPGSAPVGSQGHCHRLCLQACLCRSFAHRESTGTYVVLRLCESRWAMMLSPIQKVNRVAYC